MSTHDKNKMHDNGRHDNGRHDDDMPDALRWQLRGLRRDALPQRDLWAGIAGRIAQAEAASAAPSSVVALPVRNNKPLAWLALAASITLAIGIGWQLKPAAPGADATGTPTVVQATPHPRDPTATLIAREANAMTWEYKAALREINAHNTAIADNRALRQLDRSASQVRSALSQDPEARFLLERLQRLYAQRLALTQRLALS